MSGSVGLSGSVGVSGSVGLSGSVLPPLFPLLFPPLFPLLFLPLLFGLSGLSGSTGLSGLSGLITGKHPVPLQSMSIIWVLPLPPAGFWLILYSEQLVINNNIIIFCSIWA